MSSITRQVLTTFAVLLSFFFALLPLHFAYILGLFLSLFHLPFLILPFLYLAFSLPLTLRSHSSLSV